MNDLDALLNQLAARPIPAAPDYLREDVWREIRRRVESPGHSHLEQFAQWFWRQHVAAASIALAMVLGAGFARMGAPAQAESPASRALGLRVFSESAPMLRLTAMQALR